MQYILIHSFIHQQLQTRDEAVGLPQARDRAADHFIDDFRSGLHTQNARAEYNSILHLAVVQRAKITIDLDVFDDPC